MVDPFPLSDVRHDVNFPHLVTNSNSRLVYIYTPTKRQQVCFDDITKDRELTFLIRITRQAFDPVRLHSTLIDRVYYNLIPSSRQFSCIQMR